MRPSVIRSCLVAVVSGLSGRIATAPSCQLASFRATRSCPLHPPSAPLSGRLLHHANTASMSSSEKPKVVFVLGAPGAGKGTQCSKIVEEFGYVHLSAGDLLREERQRPGSEFGELIEDCITNGKIVPVEVTCSLLENAINKSIKESNKDKFLIDGFPRNKNNLEGWSKQMEHKTDLQFVLVFDCTEDVCVERCLKRGAEGSGRTDDNLESLKKRFNTFFNDSLPIIEHYNGQNLVRKIDGGPASDSVFAKVKNVFNEIDGSSEKA